MTEQDELKKTHERAIIQTDRVGSVDETKPREEREGERETEGGTERNCNQQ